MKTIIPITAFSLTMFLALPGLAQRPGGDDRGGFGGRGGSSEGGGFRGGPPGGGFGGRGGSQPSGGFSTLVAFPAGAVSILLHS
jgi:hypothetical protein